MSRAKISRMSGEHMVAEWVWVKFGRAVIFLHGIHYRLRCFCPHHHKPWRPFLALRLINQAWVREAHVLTTLSNRGITSFRKAKKQINDASPHIVPWSCMLFSIHASTKKQPPFTTTRDAFTYLSSPYVTLSHAKIVTIIVVVEGNVATPFRICYQVSGVSGKDSSSAKAGPSSKPFWRWETETFSFWQRAKANTKRFVFI